MPPPAQPHLPRTRARPMVRTLATWLDSPSPEHVALSTARWTEQDWAIAMRLITIHGLAAHLAGSTVNLGLDELAPDTFMRWIRAQGAMNTRRIDVLHDELAAILAAASAAGVMVMPLKGAVLTTMPDADRFRRPMSDLDLLVRPPDRLRMRVILDALGYRHLPENNPRPTHDVYLRPGNTAVISIDEHPDNPRRVEVHTEVLRHLWGWVDTDDLTSALWAGATEGVVLGQPAQIPRIGDLRAHIAIHASSDLLVGRGRLIQWLDLEALAPLVGSIEPSTHDRLVYPSLRLATRALPGTMSSTDFLRLQARIPASLARWAATVPLDDRCGLLVDSVSIRPSAIKERWRRWGPARWRLAVAYGEVSLPVALVRHAARIAGIWRGRISDSGPAASAD